MPASAARSTILLRSNDCDADGYRRYMSMTTMGLPLTAATRARQLLAIDRNFLKQCKTYRSTFVTEFSVTLSLLITYKLAAHSLGPEGFSEYAVARRTISLIFPALLLGLPLALSRYIASTTSDESRRIRFYGAALWCVGTSLALCCAIILSFPDLFAYLFFGSSVYASLAWPVTLTLVGLTVHSTVYSYYRGTLDLTYANTLQFINFAIVPLLAFYGFGENIQSVLTAWGISTIIIATACLLLTPWWEAARSSTWTDAKELLYYGLQRIPGVFAILALMTLPATFAVHLRGIQEGGFVAFGISLMNLVGALYTPIGVVLLPKASQMFADGAAPALRSHVAKLVKLAIIVALGFTLLFEILADVIVEFYLGHAFAEVALITRIVTLGALPFALFHVLQGLIDAYHTKGVNAVNALCSLALFLVACIPAFFYDPMVVMPCAFLVGVFGLGFLTIRAAQRIFSATATESSPVPTASTVIVASGPRRQSS
jgi:O-antigen/teichoic acid export membrane protein